MDYVGHATARGLRNSQLGARPPFAVPAECIALYITAMPIGHSMPPFGVLAWQSYVPHIIYTSHS